MKNKFICLFLCLFSFLIFYSNVSAKEVVINVSKEQTKLFISSLDYNGVTCENIDNLKYFEVINNEGDYTVSIKDNANIDEIYSEVLTCNYIKSNKEDNLSNDNTLKYIFSFSKNNYYEYKDLLVNETYLFKKDNVKFDSCYSLNDNVFANISNGACEVKVLKKNNVIMEVIALSNNVPYVLKINVVEDKVSNNNDVRYESVNNGWQTNELSYINYDDYLMAGDEYDKDAEDKEGDADYEADYGTAEAEVSLSKSTACTSYIINEIGSYKYFGQYKDSRIYEDPNSYVGLLGMTTFKAVEQCSGSSESYAAICLDPGMSAPTGIKYKLSRVINPTQASVNQEFDKAAYYIASQIKDEGDALKNYDNASIIATQIALRVISLTSDNTPTYYNSSSARIFYMQNKLIANELKEAKNSNKTSFKLDTWSWCQLGDTCDNGYYRENGNASIDSQIKSKTESFLTAYLNDYSGFDFPTSEEFNFSMEAVEFETQAIDDYNKKATFKGVLNIPEGINLKTDAKYKLYCHSDLECKFSLKTSGEYTLTVTYNKNQEALLKKSSNLRVRLRFTNDKMNFSVSLLEPADGGTSLQRLLIFNTDDTILWLKFSSDVAQKICDLSEFPADPTMMSDDQKDYFTSNDCCDYLSAGDPYYEKLCTCLYEDFALVCDPDTQGTSDIYTIKEAALRSGSVFIPKYSTCAVDVSWAEDFSEPGGPHETTESKVDAAGNKIALDYYKGNTYCRVTCIEEWQFATSSFKNFTGANAVKAGSYFQIDNDLFIGNKRTCVTSLIDYKKYYADIKTLSNMITVAWNSYMEFASAYDNAYDNFDHTITTGVEGTCYLKGESNKNPVENKLWIKEYKKSSTDIGDGVCVKSVTKVDRECGEDETEPCYDLEYEYYGPHKHYTYEAVYDTCNIWNVHTHKEADLKSSFTDLTEEKATTFRTDEDYLSTSTWSTACNNATHGGYCSAQDSSAGNTSPGSCPGNELTQSNAFDSIIGNLQYVSNWNQLHLRTPGHERGDDREKMTLPISGEITDGSLDLTSGNVVKMHDITEDLLNKYWAELDKLVEEMNDCQNFYLSNVLDDDTKYNYGPYSLSSAEIEDSYGDSVAKGYITSGTVIDDKDVEPHRIDTIYNPESRYQYEEAEYMTLIGTNNYLVNNFEKNNQVNTSASNNSCGETTIGGSSTKIKVCKNKITTYSYSNKWDENEEYYDGSQKTSNNNKVASNLAKKQIKICQIKRRSGGNGNGWDYGTYTGLTLCDTADLYYYEAYYIKQTLENSSFYKNKGNWFVNDKTDVKIHANSINDSGDSESVKNITSGRFVETDWSPIAAYNVFPIKITTRANIYRYMYTFGNIGHYSDNSLGRIMGKETSIILDNRHVCFYEVYEDVCKCCGDPIVTEHLDGGDPEDSDYGVITDDELLNYCKNNDCEDSEDGYTGNIADYSSTGTLGFYSSSVSLYDLDAIGDGDTNLSKNWSNNDTFYYEGDNYTTSKGGELATFIQNVGEDIYNRDPEYSYYLTPAALNAIRNTGETDFSLQGRYRIKGTDSSGSGASFSTNNMSDEEKNSVVTFGHYTSVFLHQLMSNYITDEYKDVVIDGYPMNDYCIVTASDMKSSNPFERQGTPCKWYDYVQCSGGQCFRLAYK